MTSNLRNVIERILGNAHPCKHTANNVHVHRQLIGELRAALATQDETTREHPPELMAVVDKWQDYANNIREGRLPGYSTQERAIAALLSELRGAVAPQVKVAAAVLTKCPYCERPADRDGGINHVPGCRGLERVCINQLEYDRLVPQSPPKTGCSGE